jgi:hypothetical protein
MGAQPMKQTTYTIRPRKVGSGVHPWGLVCVLSDGRESELYGEYIGGWVPLRFKTKTDALKYALDRYAWYHALARAGLQAPIHSENWRDNIPKASL